MTTKVPDSFANEQETLFLRRNDLINRWGNAVASYQALPGLVGFWPMSSVQRSTGNVYDLSGQGRTLTYNGNPTFNYAGLVPYIEFDGTGDYLSRADETDLDILGNEVIYNNSAKGLSLGGWWYFSLMSSTIGLIGKFTQTGNQRSYLLGTVSGAPRFLVSSDGSSTVAVTGDVIDTGNWYFIAATWFPNNSLNIYVNGIKTTNSSSIPGSCFASTAPLLIGGFDVNSWLLNGRASLCFLCANALSDGQIFSLYEQSRVLFGV